ncbi:CBL-interacting protein kinase 17-like [Asparagus officinalis]|uniref:CBL-interacting protein kinase 17-like n=1 Tax=Asparagus officinalis TaxID=4686 RepID=UPI00098DF63D|nr:CBL-interacting protein kinase 17-like [Asparagus officinalis]
MVFVSYLNYKNRKSNHYEMSYLHPNMQQLNTSNLIEKHVMISNKLKLVAYKMKTSRSNRGVYHKDLKVLHKPNKQKIIQKANIKISDFGLSALPQHLKNDGFLHTTCGSPNYIALEVLLNRGYDGAMSDIWSCGVILYVILTGSLQFDFRNMHVLYQKIGSSGIAYLPLHLQYELAPYIVVSSSLEN